MTTGPVSTLVQAEAMSRFAWDRRELQSIPWGFSEVTAFVREMDRAGYQFEEVNYPIGSASIGNPWEQLFQWAESIAQNERDTERGI